MFKRNSIFIRVLVPVVIVMLLQTLLISIVLTVNGTFNTLDKNATDNLQKNAENRGIALESLMVHYLSNLDKLENEVSAEIDNYLVANSVTMDEVLKSTTHQNSLLNNISPPLINALRLSSSTGTYIYFIDDFAPDMLEKAEHSYSGLYYRDQDPITTPANNSDILFVRGPVDIARKDSIQLESFWKDKFNFTLDDVAAWRDCLELLNAAINNPEIRREDLYYWNEPHYIDAKSSDMNECITYTRLFFYDGRPVGVIGAELQIEQLKKYFPASDFDSSGKAGYLLLTGNSDLPIQDRVFNILAVTGSYIRRMFSYQTGLKLTAADQYGIHTVADNTLEPTHAALQTIKLYNESSPFHNQQWVLASVGTDSLLFAASSILKTGLLYSSAIALLVGGILLGIIITLSTRPLIEMVDQIEKRDPADPIVIKKTNTYEIVLLCDTINTMRAKRQIAETELRNERERYLIALENVADTFMEYDAKHDDFILYYFIIENGKPVLHSHVTGGFSELLVSGELCHRDDIKNMTQFFNGQTTVPVELRIKCSLFSHISDTVPDGDYYWFSLKASTLRDETGAVDKMIGIAREITAEKLDEQAQIESSHRDLTTKLYNLNYGLRCVRAKLTDAIVAREEFAVLAIHIDNFDLFEAYYGRIFSAAVLMKFCIQLEMMLSDDDIALRASNDEFILYLANTGNEKMLNMTAMVKKKLEKLYMGENHELKLDASIGAALRGDGDEPDMVIGKAIAAMQTAAKTGQVILASECGSGTAPDLAELRKKPVSVSMEINKETINSVTFDLFERTSDIPSVVNLLMQMLGRLFSLSQIMICDYDMDFSTNQITYQWNRTFVKPYRADIKKVSFKDFSACERMLNENGTIIYSMADAEKFCSGVRGLLFVREEEKVSILGCAMYENGVYAGMIIFKSLSDNDVFDDADIRTLHEITKTISAHISIHKSNSASKAKSEFLSRMSHEIRTPMNAIIGMTDIAKASVNDEKRLSECLRTIELSSKHLLTLINDVLDMSRIESGKLKIEIAPFSLDALIETLERLMRPQFENKGLNFIVQKSISQAMVIGDEYRLRQVMVNLLGNACKFTDSGGTVTMTLSESDENGSLYRFSVKDTGIGINKEDHPRMFMAFEQASVSQSSHRQQGTGLGLAISNSIITAMGGKIELISEQGHGSEFYFTLKLDKGGDPASVSYSVMSAEIGAILEKIKGKHVLLVEDNDINLEIASYILGEAQMAVKVAKNGQQAVDMFAASPVGYYDVILMDIQMPVMDGLTATRWIRKNTGRADARTVPIIAMTANAFDEDMKKSIESGMNGHLTKPIEQDKMFAMMAELFSKDSI